MKRKKWTEAEEETLISAYSELVSSCGGISQLRTREKKFQPIADRVNSLHHLRDATAFPFRWSWRDVSIKIQNMRHQYLGVKLKLPSPSSAAEGPDWDHALHLWPNFLRYKAVFGDIDPHPSPFSSSPASAYASAASEDGRVENLGKMVAELGEVLVGREESRREREGSDRVGRYQRRREIEALTAMVPSEEEERRQLWRRREERREEEEMEWREKMLEMQMEHEKQVMQMHAEACQVQMQMLGIVVRLVCQFLSPTASSGAGGGDAGINGLQHHVMHNLQQQQQPQSPGSLVGDNVKNDVHSGEDYL
ncbi:hypothetical protein IEQ34_009910 [Dendrobium chrysotoxum]|uniref:Uncharacterized protein n=1 Tax=Dendrobium chrysotoxum TaxID=161865 RepID=A0AAV7H4A0_DENCH|nr:hypothetical protein IEQ34_009910 [Dendrobium chrysotoxum]